MLTYDLISRTTLSSATTIIDFTSITGTYADLIFVGNFSNTTNTDLYVRFNSSTSGYSTTQLYGNGTSAGSLRYSNTNALVLDPGAFGVGTSQANIIINIPNYANTSMSKTILARTNAASSTTGAIVGLWQNLSAITSVRLYADQNFASGSTFSLFGIAG